MTNPNTGQGVEETNTEKKNKNTYAQLIKEYSKDKLGNKENRSGYLQDLEKATSVTPDMIEDIKKFAGRDRNGTYDGLTISADEINFGSLKREAAGYFATVANNKRAIKDIYLQEFDVGEDILSQKIDTPLKALSELQVQDLVGNEKARKTFLQKHFGANNLPTEKSIANFLKEMKLEDKYKKVHPDNETAFYDVVQKIKAGRQLEDPDIETLLDSGIYTQKEKQELIAKLLPSISLAKAKRFNLIDTRSASDIKDEYIKSVDSDLDTGAVREISSNINDEDIIIATSKITEIKSNTDKIIENPSIFNDFLDRYNRNVRSFREELEGKEIRRKDDFIRILSNHSGVSGAEKFKPGAILQITQVQKTADGTMRPIKLFGKIEALGDDGKFEYIEKGNDKFDAASTTKNTQNYNEFLNFLTKGNTQKNITFQDMRVFSDDEFEAKLQSGEIGEYNGTTLRLSSKDQINRDLDDMTRDIEGLEEALKNREVQIRNDLKDQGYDDWYIKEHSELVIAGDPTIQRYKEEIEDRKAKQYQKIEARDNLESNHLETLLSKINEADEAGEKYGLKKGTTFKTKSGDIYTISQDLNLATGEVHITSLAGSESYSFEDFYRGFTSQETKRLRESATDIGAMLDNLTSDQSDDLAAWKNFAFSNGKIQKKDSKSKVEYDYLGSKKNNELLKIHDISGDQVTISFGELKSKNKTKKDSDGNDELKRGENNKIVKDETFSMESREYVVTTGFLEQYIHDNSLEPRGLKDNQEVSADTAGVNPMQKKVHFFSALFHNRATIADAVKGGTLFVEQMKEMFEKGSEEKANQFALKYMGAFLTADAKRDMQSRLEQKQKKSMEDYLERLKGVASDVAVRMIDQWLHDKYAPDYLHEAAVVFMLEKYGALNAKALQKYEGKFVWYQALGGKIDDPFFKKIQAEKVDADLPFTEELLVYRFLKEQCGQKGFNGKKRRSKLHKEVKKHRATGKEEEYETGKRDGNDERTLEGRVEGGMGEMYSNNYPNMVGWLEVAVNKGGAMHIMNKIPFIAAFSGVAYNFEEKTTDQLKNFPGGTRLLMMLRFFSHTSQLDLLNKTILAVCNTLEQKGNPKHKGIAAKAQDLFNDRHNPGDGVRSKLKKTEIFYEEYGKDLTDILYMLNTGEKNDNLSKLIFFEKDNAENPDNQILKSYYDTLHGFVDADTSFEDEGLMSDPFKGAGTSGIEMHKFAEQQLGLSHGKFKKHTSGPMSWDEIQEEFEAIPHRKYDPDSAVNKKLQIKLLSDNLGRMISGIMLSVGTNAKELAGYNTPTGPFNKLNKWGVDMTLFKQDPEFSVHGLLHPKHGGKSEEILTEFANQIIQVETSAANFSHKIINEFGPNSELNEAGGSATSIASSVDTTKRQVSQATNSPSLDEDDYDIL